MPDRLGRQRYLVSAAALRLATWRRSDRRCRGLNPEAPFSSATEPLPPGRNVNSGDSSPSRTVFSRFFSDSTGAHRDTARWSGLQAH
jgi:hypothetical protein